MNSPPQKKDLRQGHPLAPFLFVIATQGLTWIVRQAHTTNMLKGTKVGKNGVMVGFLQFANNTIHLCEAGPDNIITI